MNIYEAIRLINENVHYRPDWRIYAYYRSVDTLILSVDAILQNSDKYYAPLYKNLIRGGGTETLRVPPTTTEQQLYKMVLDALIEIEIHEAREFFKVGSDYEAPFHPHTDDGNTRWTGREVPLDSNLERVMY